MPNLLPHKFPRFDIVSWTWVNGTESEARGQKRRFLDPSEPSEPSSISENANQDDLEDGLKVWGYMPGHVHYILNKVDGEVRSRFIQPFLDLTKMQIPPRKESPTQSDKSDEVDAVLHAVPPRSITGVT